MLHNYDYTIYTDSDLDKITGSTEELQKNSTILDDLEYDDYESDDNIDIQLVVNKQCDPSHGSNETKNSDYFLEKIPIQKYQNPLTLPGFYLNSKRLICYSLINKETCRYGEDCTYAHTLIEQTVDAEKMFIYQILLDRDLMCFFSLTNPKTEDIYRELIFLTKLCKGCLTNRCTGGYNCRHGAHTSCLKICRCDLLTGKCENSVKKIVVHEDIVQKIRTASELTGSDFSTPDCYYGCNNGHHLSTRNIVPYLKYHHKMEQMSRFPYQSDTHSDSVELDQNTIKTELNGLNVELEGLEELCRDLDRWRAEYQHGEQSTPPEEIS